MKIKTDIKAGKPVSLNVAKEFTLPIPAPDGRRFGSQAYKLADGRIFVEITKAGWREP